MNAITPILPSPRVTANGGMPCEGPRCVPVLIDFSLGGTYQLDFSQLQSLAKISGVQTMYVDNSGNPNSITLVTSPTTNQTIIVPPNSQAYLPLLQTNPPVLTFTTTYTGKIMVQLLNFYIAPCVWGTVASPGGGGTVTVTDPILDATVANTRVNVTDAPFEGVATDYSGTITVGGTAQQVLAANLTRKKLIVSNPDTATEVLHLMFGAGGNGQIPLLAGMTWVSDGTSIETNSVWLVAATTAHAFTCYEVN